MYTDWFQLAHKPFAITPDPRFLFLSERHREALAHLLFGVNEGGGFILLTGEVGTGKTTLTRTLLQQVPAHVDAALIFNPRVSLTEFLELICDELRVTLPEGPRTPKMMTDALNRHLLDAHARGRRTVLIVDEAQSLDPELLEQVRLLTNLETDRDKLLQILLIGQPELRDTLRRQDLRQLAQRITARFHLDPLDEDETAAYVRHRLEVAGARTLPFTPASLRAVHRASGGVPRLINVICDRAMLGAWANKREQVDTALVRIAAEEVHGGPLPRPRRTMAFLAGVALVVLIAAVALWPRPIVETEPAPVIATPAPVAIAPVRVDPVEEAPPTLTLMQMLSAVDTGLAAAAGTLLARWDVEGDDDLPGSLCRVAVEAGLACLRERADWRTLRERNRPAMLELVTPAGDAHAVVLVGLDTTHGELALDDLVHRFPLEEIGGLWFGELLTLWHAPLPADGLLRLGSTGTGVLALRELLDSASPNQDDVPDVRSELYDRGLEDRVRAFQARAGIEVDGIAGEQTLLALDAYSTTGPRLTRHVTDP